MNCRCFTVAYIVMIVLAFGQNAWIETSQADFSDGIYERNLYASVRGGGTVEFAPKFDLNRDGYIDLFTADVGGPDVEIHWGSAAGYTSSTVFATSGADNCDAADLDHDGYVDFVVSHRSVAEIKIYWGSSTGPNPYNYLSINGTVSARQGVFVADFDKDGYLDIATGQQFTSGNAAVLWGSASGYSGSNRTDLPLQWSVHNIEVADYNKDGWLDILFTNYMNPGNYIYWGSSSGFSPANSIGLENPYGSHGTSVADLNKDAYLDLIFTAWDGGNSYIYWGSDTGYSNTNKQILYTGGSWGGSAVADFDSDGYLDIVFHRGGGGSHQQIIFWGSAIGYSSSDTSYIGTPIQATGGLVADLDYDGHLDIFCNAYSPGTESPIFWGPSFTTSTVLAVNGDHHGMFREIGNVYDRLYKESYVSSVFDAGEIADWDTLNWIDSLPSGTSVTLYVRSGNTPSYDPTWSDWCMLANGAPIPDSLSSRYIQYNALFHYTNPSYLPCLYEVCISYSLGPYVAVISPNGGEYWIRGTAQEITWASNGVTGNVKIELYKNDTYNSTIAGSVANTGSYVWDIAPGLLPADDYQIKLSSVASPAISDLSDDDFTVCSQILLTTPNGGEIWYIGEDHDIMWAPSGIGGNVALEYSTNGGSDWIPVSANTADDGVYSWNVPGTPTIEGRMKVTHQQCTTNHDESDSNFTITQDSIIVLSPNGGEYLLRGDSCEISWVGSGLGATVDIELYKGGSFSSTIASGAANNGIYLWNIPSTQLPADDYRVRISSVANPTLFDFSDDDFGIYSQITVTAPNGGETWYIGETYDINWACSGIGGSVIIEYSTNSGSSWLIVTSTTEDDGNYAWTIPNTATTQGRVKLTHLLCTSNMDESDGDFTITFSSVNEQTKKNGIPTFFHLDQNHPNPFSTISALKYAVPKPCRVEIEVYDVSGKAIAELLDCEVRPGYYQLVIDVNDMAGCALPNGIYFYRMTTDGYTETRSMTVLR